MGSKQKRKDERKRREALRHRSGQQTIGGENPPSNHQHSNNLRSAGRSHGRDQLTVAELLALGVTVAGEQDPSFAEVSLERVVDLLVDADGLAADVKTPSEYRPEQLLAKAMLGQIGGLWERGWQPADLAHVARNFGSQRLARLAAWAIVVEERDAGRGEVMPESWTDQLSALDVTAGTDTILFRSWRAERTVSLYDALHDGLRLAALLNRLPAIATIAEPPSRWAAAAQARRQRRPLDGSGSNVSGAGSAAARKAASEKVLATIRALLAKAESTTFPAEAEAFAAKAQALMSRHSIDVAMLDPRHGDELIAGVEVRRMHLDNPYAKEKVSLLAVVARVNQGKVIYDEAHAMATVFGFPADLDATDLLFTSLLVQASRSLVEATKAMGRAKSPAFRRAFWISYAVRVGERLQFARDEAASEAEAEHGTALVPVMKERAEAIDTVLKRVFARTTPMKARRVDSQGWVAGRTAADLADIGNQRSPLAR